MLFKPTFWYFFKTCQFYDINACFSGQYSSQGRHRPLILYKLKLYFYIKTSIIHCPFWKELKGKSRKGPEKTAIYIAKLINLENKLKNQVKELFNFSHVTLNWGTSMTFYFFLGIVEWFWAKISNFQKSYVLPSLAS